MTQLNTKPLREHKLDILPIAKHYLSIFKSKHESKVQCFSEEIKKAIMSHKWSGNVRELKNTPERLCVLCDHEDVDLSDIFYYGKNDRVKGPCIGFFHGQDDPAGCEKEHILKTLRHFHFQINKMTESLVSKGLSASHMGSFTPSTHLSLSSPFWYALINQYVEILASSLPIRQG